MTNEKRDRILVPLDGSKNAENAIPLAVLMAKVLDCDVEFIQAREPVEDGAEEDAKAAEIFEAYATKRAAHFGILPERFSATSPVGPAAATVLDASDAPGVRGIALASHGRGGFRATLFGSVADRIIRGAKVPVLVVPGVGGPATEITEILVTLDGSDVAERALGPARRVAKALGARLSLLRAYTIVSPGAAAYPYYPPDIPQQLADAARDYVKSVAQEGEQSLVVQADPATGIVAAANDLDVDLVVMSSHGKGFSKRFIVGSTTDSVMHELHRPLLIIPPARD
ncbi:MAG: universal stress protein [Tepidiformaceae bacterium]